ncbi:hypothetical protein DN402_02215 [Streptomyces sp. SW4]|nr:hypothetical protein DN402_02215 [Streptomyces sp. SW4]
MLLMRWLLVIRWLVIRWLTIRVASGWLVIRVAGPPGGFPGGWCSVVGGLGDRVGEGAQAAPLGHPDVTVGRPHP